MSLQTLSKLIIPEEVHCATGFTSLLIDASGEKVEFVFNIPKTGNITQVGFRTGAVTSAQTLRVELQTVDGTTGDASGSAYGGMVKGTQASPAANTFYDVALGTAASATQGDTVAAVIEFDGTVGNLNIAYLVSLMQKSMPYVGLYTGTWAKSIGVPVLSIKYDDGSYYDCSCWPGSAFNTQNINTGTATDERALKFKFPYPVRVRGAWVYSSPAGTTSDYDVVLYDSDGTTALQTKSVDANNLQTTGARRISHAYFPASQTLSKDTFYRLSIKPTTANNLTFDDFSVDSAGILDSIGGGQNFHLSTRADAGAWTDTTTKRPFCGLILDQFDDGTAVGGGGNVFMTME